MSHAACFFLFFFLLKRNLFLVIIVLTETADDEVDAAIRRKHSNAAALEGRKGFIPDGFVRDGDERSCLVVETNVFFLLCR